MKNFLLALSIPMIETWTIAIIFLALCVKSTFEAIQTRKIIEESKQKQFQSKQRREKILESLQDTHMIFDYFLEIKERLPDSLHNVMLMYCLNDDYYALKYLNSIDSKTGLMKPKRYRYE
jgi:hypothetical protein